MKGRIRRLRRRPGWVAMETRVSGFAIWVVLNLLRATTRLEVRGRERLEENWRDRRPMVFAFWHGRSIMLPFLYRGHGLYIMNSLHRDGEMITRALERFGLRATRGSSSRGAVSGTRALVRALREGNDVALIPDGPRGPAAHAKGGVVELAMMGHAPLFPVAFSARPSLRLTGWDRMMIPLPGARVVCVVGDPIDATGQAPGKAGREALRVVLESRLREVTREADGATGRVREDA
jgi:lysophospholipid acyltransferase (LPLAT)-like uncharacterized protein